jgi:hypothetical protein
MGPNSIANDSHSDGAKKVIRPLSVVQKLDIVK